VANRSITLDLKANVDGYVAGMKKAKTATNDLAKSTGESTKKVDQAMSKAGDTKGLVGRFKAARDGVKSHLQDMGRSMDDWVRKNESAMTEVGGILAGAGAAFTGLGVFVGKAAMDWESAWAGVAKTNDGTAQQMRELEQGLRDMTGVLPASHQEIAAVAEAAGQLGVGIEDVQGFTKVMIDLGESTNLSSEEAASALAKFSNIMGTNLQDADRLGSTIVGLGNNFATTEQDIVNMSMRLAGAGKQMGMSEGDVMGLATAMSSVGIEAEAGGTAMTTVMKKIDGAVRNGGDALQGWADAAGVSAQEFAAAWESDPAMALDTLVTGLSEAGASGEDMNQILTDLGVKGIRESDTLIRLAGAAGLVGEAVELGNQEWEKNTALVEEASKRYETAESRIAIAWNRIKDAAITAGGAILPAIAGLADGAADLVDAFAGLPDWVQEGLGAMAAIAGVATLAAGGFLTLAPKVVAAKDAFKSLSTGSPKLTGALGKLGKAAGIAGGAFVALEVGKGILNSLVEFEATVESAGNALLKLDGTAQSMAGIDEMFKLDNMVSGTSNIQSFSDALDALDPSTPNEHVASFGDTVLGLKNPTAEARDAMGKLDTALSAMEPDVAATKVKQLKDELEAAGRTDLSNWEGLKRLFPEYAASVEEAANATGKATSEADLYQAAMGNLPAHMRPVTEAMEETSDATEAAAESMDRMSTIDPDGAHGLAEAMGVLADESKEADERLDGVLDALIRMGAVESTAIQATGDYAEAVRGMSAAVKENGKNLDVTTEKGKANMDALIGLRDAGNQLVDANARAGESVGTLRENLQSTYTDLVESAKKMGATSGEADYLARTLMGIPEGVDIHTAMDDQARVIAEATGQAIDLIPGYKGVTLAVTDDGTAGSVQERINSVTGKKETIFVSDDGTVTDVQQRIISVNGVERTVWVDDQGTIVSTQKDIDAIQDTDATVHVGAAKDKAESDINHTARDRVASVTALAHVNTAEGDLNDTSRERVASVDALAHITRAEGELNYTARPRTAPIIAEAAIQSARRMLDSLKAPIFTPVNAAFGTTNSSRSSVGVLRRGYASGGRLPYTGRGTDQILGVSSSGAPVARVDDGEWIIRESSARKYDGVLAAINRDAASVRHLAGYTSGGRVGVVRRDTPAAPAPGIDYDRLAAALAAQPIIMKANQRELARATRGARMT